MLVSLGTMLKLRTRGTNVRPIWTGLTPWKVTNPDMHTILTWSRYQIFSHLKYLVEISSFLLNIYLVSIVDTADLFQVCFHFQGYWTVFVTLADSAVSEIGLRLVTTSDWLHGTRKKFSWAVTFYEADVQIQVTLLARDYLRPREMIEKSFDRCLYFTFVGNDKFSDYLWHKQIIEIWNIYG